MPFHSCISMFSHPPNEKSGMKDSCSIHFSVTLVEHRNAVQHGFVVLVLTYDLSCGFDSILHDLCIEVGWLCSKTYLLCTVCCTAPKYTYYAQQMPLLCSNYAHKLFKSPYFWL